MAVEVGNFESQKYRKLFEFMQQHGVEKVTSFLDDYEALSREDLLNIAVMEGRHLTLSLLKEHRDACRLLRDLSSEGHSLLLRKDVSSFIRGVTNDILPRCIEGARQLEDIGVSNIGFIYDDTKSCAFQTIIKYDEDNCIECIEKSYTNGIINYSVDEESSVDSLNAYNTSIAFPNSRGNFVITVQNCESGLQYRYAKISDFLFDTNLLPSMRELSSYEVPASLATSKVYVKR